MLDLNYLCWEWKQSYEAVFVYQEPAALELLGLYPVAVLAGLTLLHRCQLRASERKGQENKAAYLRRQLRWEQPTVIIIFVLWFAAAMFPMLHG